MNITAPKPRDNEIDIKVWLLGQATYREISSISNTRNFQARRAKKVETVFSIITSRFGNVIKATSIDGFLTKLKLFITAYSTL